MTYGNKFTYIKFYLYSAFVNDFNHMAMKKVLFSDTSDIKAMWQGIVEAYCPCNIERLGLQFSGPESHCQKCIKNDGNYFEGI